MAFKRIRVHRGKHNVLTFTSTRVVSRCKTKRINRLLLEKAELKRMIGHKAYCLAVAIFRNSFVEAIQYEKNRIVIYADRFKTIKSEHEERIVKLLVSRVFYDAKRIEISYE